MLFSFATTGLILLVRVVAGFGKIFLGIWIFLDGRMLLTSYNRF